MEKDLQEIIENIAECIQDGHNLKAVVIIVFHINDIIQYKRELREEKLSMLNHTDYDVTYKYNKVILHNFVKRKFQYYESGEKISIHDVKAKIEKRNSVIKTVIITGQAGSGKSTVLKWLFVNVNISECIFLYAKEFFGCRTLNQVFSKISDKIPKDKASVIFLDGIDELPCIKGTKREFDRFIQFLNEKTNPENGKPACKFVISSRPEHFEFHNKIIERNAARKIENYAVLELGKLEKKEALKVCKSIKKLYQFDRENGSPNSNDLYYGWPEKKKKGKNFSEKEYLRLLKKYLNTVTMDRSLLDIPLLCRFAYQIVWEWNFQKQQSFVQNEESISLKIEKVIEICIKAEFYDEQKRPENADEEEKKFNKYKNQVWDFLANLAGVMGQNESINREQWEEVKDLEKIKKVNRAFCVLQEVKDSENEELRFVHGTFKDYFLAYYFASTMYEKTDEDRENLRSLLESNSEFAVMYIEQLQDGTNQSAKKICEELLSVAKKDKEKVLEYARGILRLHCKWEISFTIEDYLTVFPSGKFIYAGITFDRDTFTRLMKEGLLEIRDAGFLEELEENRITAKNFEGIIKGLQIQMIATECMAAHFWVYLNGKIEFIYGVESYRQNLKKISQEKSNLEHEMLLDARTRIINFMGKTKNFWCLFDGKSLFVYQMIPQNEEKMKELFHNHYLENPVDYVVFYGIYKSITDKEKFFSQGTFKEFSDINFEFDASRNRIESKNELSEYYDVYYTVRQLFRKKAEDIHDEFLNLDNEAMDLDDRHLDLVSGLFNLCDDIKDILENISDGKLRLYFIDELLYVLYMIGDREHMVNLADETIALCEEYGHSGGIRFRTLLMQDRLRFSKEDFQKIYEFAKNHIWM